MKYVISDIHGEFELFVSLIKHINFSNEDSLYVCGDIIDKGPQSVRVAKYISHLKNVHCIIGNHEHAFLKYYHSLLDTSPEDFDALLIDEIAPPPRVICVEWPENVKDALEPSIELKLSIEANGNHRVELA